MTNNIRNISILIICLAFSFFSCGNDATNTTNPKKPIANTTPKTNELGKPSPTSKKKNVSIYAKNAAGKVGEVICTNIEVQNFNEILSMQYTMSWDASILEFVEAKDYGLKGMTKASFGAPNKAKDKMGISWFDQDLKGLSKGDGEVLYQLCFKAIGAAGSETSIKFGGDPIIVEIVDGKNNFYNLNTRVNTIKIQ